MKRVWLHTWALFRSGMRVILVWLWIYIIFNLFWGLNYNRLGIAHQAGVQVALIVVEASRALPDGGS